VADGVALPVGRGGAAGRPPDISFGAIRAHAHTLPAATTAAFCTLTATGGGSGRAPAATYRHNTHDHVQPHTHIAHRSRIELVRVHTHTTRRQCRRDVCRGSSSSHSGGSGRGRRAEHRVGVDAGCCEHGGDRCSVAAQDNVRAYDNEHAHMHTTPSHLRAPLGPEISISGASPAALSIMLTASVLLCTDTNITYRVCTSQSRCANDHYRRASVGPEISMSLALGLITASINLTSTSHTHIDSLAIRKLLGGSGGHLTLGGRVAWRQSRTDCGHKLCDHADDAHVPANHSHSWRYHCGAAGWHWRLRARSRVSAITTHIMHDRRRLRAGFLLLPPALGN
jgi:hypothetical protein